MNRIDEPTDTVEVSISKTNRRIYKGIFADNRGNPNVNFYGYVLEEIFTLFALYLLATNNFKYSVYFILLFALGSVINAIRFYYVNPLIEGKSDQHFLTYTVMQNTFNSIISVAAMIYMLFVKK